MTPRAHYIASEIAAWSGMFVAGSLLIMFAWVVS